MKDLIEIAAEEFIDKWNQLHNSTIPYIKHKFDLKGRVAGQFWYRSTDSWFRWNMPLAEQNSDDYLINVVGHEVAHWITHNIYPQATAHGYEWKQVMQKLGLEPARCHNYQTKPARIVKRPYKYTCQCGNTMAFTIKLFKNIVLKGLTKTGQSTYYCAECKTFINIKNIKTN